MAIKINRKDLARRIINWQDLQKVILNWSQIRPTEQKYIDYHIISKWGTWWWGGGWGWVPWWWSTWWSTEIWYSGISNWGTWQTANLNYQWLPSLINAYKVEIIYSFYWDVTNQPSQFKPLEAQLYKRSTLTYQTDITSSWGSTYSYMFWIYASPYPSWISQDYLTSWDYTITAKIDFENEVTTQNLKWPWIDETWNVSWVIRYRDIKYSDSFWVYLNDGIMLKRIDFFVYNTPGN